MARITNIPHRIVNAGDVASNTIIHVYQAGTSTNIPLFSDEALTNSVMNPLTVTAGSPIPILYHAFTGEVRVEVSDTNGTIFDDDPYDHPVSASELASTEGAAMVGVERGGTLQSRINILSATWRPAMAGIFSSGSDQLAALRQFVADAASDGKVIEWGPIDLSVDVITQIAGERGLIVPSGSRWVMHPDFRLRALPNSANVYEILTIHDKHDIVIEGSGARIVGDRVSHSGSTGEHGMCVSIRGSSNITVRDLHAEDAWGDGWYIGASPNPANQNHVREVQLERISSNRARRNGLSLISARGFRCIDYRGIDTNGTLPEYGIDIEPNNPDEYLENIEFVRPYTKGNANYGLGIYLNAMEGTANPVGIRILNHVDDGSFSALAANRAVDIRGLIEYIDALSRNAAGPGIISRGKGVSGPFYKIVNPTIIDWNRNGASGTFSSGILVYAPSADSGTYALGGFDIVNPDLRLNSGASTNAVMVTDQRTTTPDAPTGMRVLDPLNLANLPMFRTGIENITDRYRASVRMLPDANMTLANSNYYMHNISPLLTGHRLYDIANTLPAGMETVIEVGGGGSQTRVRFPSGATVHPENVGVNRYFLSNTIGSIIRIRKVDDLTFWITERIGNWVAA